MGIQHPHSTQSWAENCDHEPPPIRHQEDHTAARTASWASQAVIKMEMQQPFLWTCLYSSQVQRLVMQKILCRNQTCWFLLTCLIVSRHKHPIRNLKTPTSTQVFTSWNFAYHWWDFTSESSCVKANAGILNPIYSAIWGWTIFSAHLR